ncbi:5-(carboxyamino)imidazole ribonucleotide synthase [Microbacterium esteraromaticum]|uniref:N5-carboxyaminoimidazole ribonucleotide synthase n=1 Tax=Microbacterium esteraromaticum TaxID=57043 RepID=A0A939DVI3_9MICO|nr:5-(carboxyamino)imidazole ribonucleotide synthase [Microbacterium esteraromaticum]MBN8205681.1 5-(carboxyamino)imidazole ribonucleotide synthase [Microbacterium esteraromaticum]MBN8415835.1 5-(carboxyamino)imidazole ribonucleotide synthase [Microbacterium esteraromaticum]MBY6060649.1 5-(carboxyamino)imidazole ribonucleotide synthase [Microbacterium esteraromaticum]WDH79799.1 5-(carboxyamino)imidazole ribonucleotide synthase [Microbacterium esteraromaticum]
MSVRVGVIGGGQLARMMIAPAVELGLDVRVLAEDEGMSAALAATAVGDYRDLDAVRAFARDVDVITFDHEHVPQQVLRALVADGVQVHPGPDALQYAQDKLVMRARLAELGVPQPDWAAVHDARELQAFINDHGGRAVVKTPRGGYDGKGVRVVRAGLEAADWFEQVPEGEALLAEEMVSFTRELAQQIARRPSGDVVAYPVVETVQRGGVCAEVIAPAPNATERLAEVAEQIGRQIAEGIGVTGMLAVELFETDDERILVNELAMRPHNSGHWSQDGAVTGQFEQHLRAVADLPLGSTAPRAPWTVMVNILGGPAEGTLTSCFAPAMEQHPEAKIHTYGKAPRPGRKVGHINVAGADLDDVVYTARAAAVHFE